MKNYKFNRYALVLGLVLGGAISLTANAESEARLLVNHRIVRQPVDMGQGQMLVEIVNAGTEALKGLALSLEDPSGLQIIPERMLLGTLEPKHPKSVNVTFTRLNLSGDEIDKALVWRVDYQSLNGTHLEARILDSGRNQPIAEE